MVPEALATRIKAIRYPIKDLAKAAGKTDDTVARLFGQRSDKVTDPRSSTLQAIEKALLEEETRLRDYLLGLHPIAKPGETGL